MPSLWERELIGSITPWRTAQSALASSVGYGYPALARQADHPDARDRGLLQGRVPDYGPRRNLDQLTTRRIRPREAHVSFEGGRAGGRDTDERESRWLTQLGVCARSLINVYPGTFQEGLPTHLAASGFAGFCCSATSNPIDVVKVSLESQPLDGNFPD